MKYTLTFLGILMVALSHAQTNNLPQWHFGVKADFNLYNISGNGMASGYTAGVAGGIYAEHTFNNRWAVQPELLISQNNTKQNGFNIYYPGVNDPNAAQDIKLAYINIPVMIKYNVTDAFSFLVGPQYSFLIVDAESLLRLAPNKAFKTSEFAGAAGAQYNIKRVSIYGRFTQGFSNINNVDKDDATDKHPWRASHIQLGVAVRVF